MTNPQVTLAHAVTALKAGGVVAYPTETMYALAVDIRLVAAVENLRAVKAREAHKPLAILVAQPSDIHALVRDVSPTAQLLMREFWPGPLTLIFNVAPGLAPGLSAQTGTVAVRCSRHPVAQALAKMLGGAITATGCNQGGGRGVRLPSELDPTLASQLACILEGDPLPEGNQCSVVDARLGAPTVVREGALSTKILAQVWS